MRTRDTRSLSAAVDAVSGVPCRPVYDIMRGRIAFASQDTGEVFRSASETLALALALNPASRPAGSAAAAATTMGAPIHPSLLSSAERAYGATATISAHKGDFGSTASGCSDSRENRAAIRDACDASTSRAIAERAEQVDGRKLSVLNLGCGRGQDYGPFLKARAVLGWGCWVDVSAESLEVSRERAGKLSDCISYVCGDMNRQEAWDAVGREQASASASRGHTEGFDLVVSTLAIHYGMGGGREAASLLLGRIARVCRVGCAMIFTCMSEAFVRERMRSCRDVDKPHALSAAVWTSDDGYCRLRSAGADRVVVSAGCSVLGVTETLLSRDAIERAAERSGWAVTRYAPLGESWPLSMYCVCCLELIRRT